MDADLTELRVDQNEFLTQFKRVLCPKLAINVMGKSIEEICDAVVLKLPTEKFSKNLVETMDGIGKPRNPKVVFLADQPNGIGSSNVVFWGSHSGQFLFSALGWTLDLRKIHVVNSKQANGETLTRDFFDELQPQKIVALGLAARARSPVAVDATVPHPQWVRRFRANQIRRYANVLYRAVDKNKTCLAKDF